MISPAPPAVIAVAIRVGLGFLVCFAVACGAPPRSASGTERSAPRPPGPEAPPLELPDIAGRHVALSELRGRPVIVNFWATWCQPCRRELPSLEELHRRFEPAGLRVLAVSIDADPQELDRFVADASIPFVVLRDPEGKAAAAYGVTTVPSTFLVDAAGRVSERIDGEVDWGREDLLGEVQRLLAEAGPADDQP